MAVVKVGSNILYPQWQTLWGMMPVTSANWATNSLCLSIDESWCSLRGTSTDDTGGLQSSIVINAWSCARLKADKGLFDLVYRVPVSGVPVLVLHLCPGNLFCNKSPSNNTWGFALIATIFYFLLIRILHRWVEMAKKQHTKGPSIDLLRNFCSARWFNSGLYPSHSDKLSR